MPDDTELETTDPASYGPAHQEHTLEQYKVYVESAERISDRRQGANSFFLATNTLLIGAEGALLNQASQLAVFQVFIGITGALLCYTWYRMIRSYKNINTGKFKIIHAIEAQLPLKLYRSEWAVLKEGKDPKTYLPFTNIELRIPWIFFGLHTAAVAVAAGFI